jgi:hypothetical protein
LILYGLPLRRFVEYDQVLFDSNLHLYLKVNTMASFPSINQNPATWS